MKREAKAYLWFLLFVLLAALALWELGKWFEAHESVRADWEPYASVRGAK